MQRLGTSMRRTRSQRREMYWPRPPDSSWSSPHQRNERQGRCGGLWNLEPSMAHPDALRFIPRELLLRTKRGRVAWACSANMLICFVIRVLTTATAQWAVGNVTVADEGCDDGRGEYSNPNQKCGLSPWILASPSTAQRVCGVPTTCSHTAHARPRRRTAMVQLQSTAPP